MPAPMFVLVMHFEGLNLASTFDLEKCSFETEMAAPYRTKTY